MRKSARINASTARNSRPNGGRNSSKPGSARETFRTREPRPDTLNGKPSSISKPKQRPTAVPSSPPKTRPTVRKSWLTADNASPTKPPTRLASAASKPLHASAPLSSIKARDAQSASTLRLLLRRHQSPRPPTPTPQTATPTSRPRPRPTCTTTTPTPRARCASTTAPSPHKAPTHSAWAPSSQCVPPSPAHTQTLTLSRLRAVNPGVRQRPRSTQHR